jgi:hypothetical protein
MPAYFKIDKEHRLVMSTISGVLTLADALAHQENLRKHPDFDPSFSQLMDGTQLTRVELKREEVQRLARDSIFSPDSRRAFVTDSDAAFGMARMFETLRDAMGERGIRVFRNLDDGLDWVLGKNSPA